METVTVVHNAAAQKTHGDRLDSIGVYLGTTFLGGSPPLLKAPLGPLGPLGFEGAQHRQTLALP